MCKENTYVHIIAEIFLDKLDHVSEFSYLASKITADGKDPREFNRRTGLKKSLFNNKKIQTTIRVQEIKHRH